MAFSNPIVGASDALVREAIQSPNFVAGVSGWRIAKDGTAEFANVVIRGSVHIPGDTPPAELVLDTLGDGVPYIVFTGESGDSWFMRGTDDVGFDAWFSLVGPNVNTPGIDLVEGLGVYISSAENSQSPGVVIEGNNGFSVTSAPGFLKRYGGASFADIEDWVHLTYSNGWNNTGGNYEVGRYRLTPDGFVVLEGLLAPGTTADGTTMFTLPAGYRPNKDLLFLCNTGSAKALVGLQVVASSGNCNCFGAGAGGISLSGVQFGVAALGA